MTSPADERAATALERQVQQAFKASVANLDAATLSRLNQSRQQALAAVAGRTQSSRRWLTWVPAGAVAAAALLAVLLLRAPPAPSPQASVAASVATDLSLDPLDLLAAGDDLELAAAADLDFYAWVELETAADGVT